MDIQPEHCQHLRKYLNQIAFLGLDTQLEFAHKKFYIYLGNNSYSSSLVSSKLNLFGEVVRNLGKFGIGNIVLFFQESKQKIKKNQNEMMSESDDWISWIKQINSDVSINITEASSIQFIVEKHDCIIILNCFDIQFLIKLNNTCRKAKKPFIYCGTLGPYGFIFNDFGLEHKVQNPFCQKQIAICIDSISQGQKTTIYVGNNFSRQKRNFQIGESIIFQQVKGMDKLNGKIMKIIEVEGRQKIYVGDTRKFGQYISGGLFTKVIQPEFIKFSSLQNALVNPAQLSSNSIMNYKKQNQAAQLHIALNGIFQFWKRNKRLPQKLNKQDSNQLIQLTIQWHQKNKNLLGQIIKCQNVDTDLIQKIALYAQTQISPISSFWGGIVAVQATKITGKLIPFNQWVHYDFYQHLPRKINKQQHGYCGDYQILYGPHFTKNAAQIRAVIVGAGSKGCEILKIFADMGIGRKGKGNIFVIDDQNIKENDVVRNCFFSQKDIGLKKAEVACRQAQKLNSNCSFTPIVTRFQKSSVHLLPPISNIKFFISATQSQKTNLFLEELAILHEFPYFHFSTNDSNCFTQIVLPFATSTYSEIANQPEYYYDTDKSTSKNFPFRIEHTIEYAVDFFDDFFQGKIGKFRDFCLSKDKYTNELKMDIQKRVFQAQKNLKDLKQIGKIWNKKNYQGCVEAAVNLFVYYFQTNILKLLEVFPKNKIIEYTSQLFWQSGYKKCPRPIKLNLEDRLHVQFIKCTAQILCIAFNIPIPENSNLSQIINKFYPKIPSQVQSSQKMCHSYSESSQQQCQSNSRQIQLILKKKCQLRLAQLLKSSVSQPQCQAPPIPPSFHRSSPTPLSLNFIYLFSTIRALNYGIKPISKMDNQIVCCRVKGKNTGMVGIIGGFVGLQVGKFVGQKGEEGEEGWDIMDWRNFMGNMSAPALIEDIPNSAKEETDKEFDPIMCGPTIAIPKSFNKWYKICIKGPMTVRQLKMKLQKDFCFEICMLFCERYELYSDWNKKSRHLYNMDIEQALKYLSQQKQKLEDISSNNEFIKITPGATLSLKQNKQPMDAYLPDIKYYF